MMLEPSIVSALVQTETLSTWDDTKFCVIETGMTRGEFDAGHIPGSVFWPISELMTPHFELQTDPARFAALLSRSGIGPDTVVVCSFGGEPFMAGWASWLYWVLTGFGHARAVVLDGGTEKWRAEGRAVRTEEAARTATVYPTPAGFGSAERAMLPRVLEAVEGISEAQLVDARSHAEYRGENFYDKPPRDGERAGRIPGARHLPNMALLGADDVYRPLGELRELVAELGLSMERPAITYCAVGIRSSMVWFALRHLLRFPEVRNYDGSWNEWSRAVSAETELQIRGEL